MRGPVSAERSGMKSLAPLRPVASAMARVQALKSPVFAASRLPALAKKSGPASRDPRDASAETGTESAGDHGHEFVDLGRNRTSPFTTATNLLRPHPLATHRGARRATARSVRIGRVRHGLALPVPQLRVVETRSGVARAARSKCDASWSVASQPS